LIGSGSRRLLNILHIDPEKNWGGGEAQVFGLLDYLSARGHRNDLLADPNGLLYANCRTLDIRLRPLSVRNDLDLYAAAALRRLISTETFDIVHFHTKRAHALSLWLWPRRSRPKYIATRRMDYPERRGWYTNLLYNHKLDGVVAISRVIAELLAQAGVNREKIRHIPSGIDLARFNLADSHKLTFREPLVIGSVAVLETRKGHEFLLEAAALLKADGAHLTAGVVGHDVVADRGGFDVAQLDGPAAGAAADAAAAHEDVAADGAADAAGLEVVAVDEAVGQADGVLEEQVVGDLPAGPHLQAVA